MPKLIMLIGLPGCGKSTYAKTLLEENKVMYTSSDKVREEMYGDESIQGDPNKVFKRLHEKVTTYLAEGYDVIYDATNVTRKNRKNVIDKFSKYANIEAHIVWAPFQQCVARDKNRNRVVGEDVIRKFLYRWESPNYDEGFSDIKLVYNCDIGWDNVAYSNVILDSLHIPHDNPHHTLNVAEHSNKVREYADINRESNQIILACMYHDIGKPFTKFYKEDSIAHYYNHDNVGGYFVYGCFSADYNKEEVISISWIVSNHMQPYFDSNYYRNLPENYKKLLDSVHNYDVQAH